MESIQYTPLFEASGCKYTSCYCEENTYMMCKRFTEICQAETSLDEKVYLNKGYCVFVTNPEKKSEIRYQKAGSKHIHNTVIWDYHVFFVHKMQNKDKEDDYISRVYDLDTILPFPEIFSKYYEKSFDFEKDYPLFFRVIEADLFLENFASDRSHMVTGMKKDGKKFVKAYSATPPDYPNIVNKNKETMNLEIYWDLKNTDSKFGKVMKQSDFFDFFCKK